MMPSRFLKTAVGVALGVVATLAALEGALRLLPVQEGISAADADDAWPVHHLMPGRSLTWSAQWHLANRTPGRTNNLGYVAPFDYEPGTRMLAVLGDSYVESLMNPYDATLQAQVQQLAGNRMPVYNFGIGGSALPDYLGLAPLVADRFRVEGLVVMIGDGDFIEGFTPRPGHFTWTAAAAASPVTLQPDVRRSPAVKAVRELALFRYVRGNLRMTPETLFKSRPSHEPVAAGCVSSALQPGDADLVRAFVRELPAAYGIEPAAIALVVDSETHRRAMYDAAGRTNTASACTTRDALALEALATEAERAGFAVVRLAPIFDAHYRRTGERVDHSPDDWHWNATGHRLAAARAVDALAAAGKAPVADRERASGVRSATHPPDRAAVN